jgi:hypothetical protein
LTRRTTPDRRTSKARAEKTKGVAESDEELAVASLEEVDDYSVREGGEAAEAQGVYSSAGKVVRRNATTPYTYPASPGALAPPAPALRVRVRLLTPNSSTGMRTVGDPMSSALEENAGRRRAERVGGGCLCFDLDGIEAVRAREKREGILSFAHKSEVKSEFRVQT